MWGGRGDVLRVFDGIRWSRGIVGVAGLGKAGSLGGLSRWGIGDVAESGGLFVVEAWWVCGDIGGEALRYAASDGRQQRVRTAIKRPKDSLGS